MEPCVDLADCRLVPLGEKGDGSCQLQLLIFLHLLPSGAFSNWSHKTQCLEDSTYGAHGHWTLTLANDTPSHSRLPHQLTPHVWSAMRSFQEHSENQSLYRVHHKGPGGTAFPSPNTLRGVKRLHPPVQLHSNSFSSSTLDQHSLCPMGPSLHLLSADEGQKRPH